MKIHGNLNLLGNQLMQATLEMEDEFPAEPQPGRLLFREQDRTLYICASLEQGLPVWVPIARIRTMYKHTQSDAALEWTITHNLNMAPAMVQVYDNNGKWVIPDSVVSQTPNQITVRFAQAVAGHAIVLRGDIDGTQGHAVAYEQSFTNVTEVTVNHGLGYNPDIKVYVNGQQVQPQSIVQNSTMVATVTFNGPTTGIIVCA